MSSAMKGLLLKSNTNDMYMRKLVKEKYREEQIQLFQAKNIHVNWCTDRGKVIRCNQEANGFSNPRKQNIGSLPPHAILTPVSDPTSTTKKVLTCLFE